MKVVHLTSVHPRTDTRIFIKQCQSLTKQGFEVSLVVADDLGNEVKAGVAIFDVGKSLGRWQRILRAPKRVYQRAVSLDAEIYHLHDPELLPIGVKLKRLGKKVIFDAHEDFPQQLLSKPYLRHWVKKPLSWLAGWYERRACAKFDAVVAATPYIRDKFQRFHPHVVDVNNFPVMGELESVNPDRSRVSGVCYVGGMDEVRGIRQMVQAMQYVEPEIELSLGGQLGENHFKDSLQNEPSWQRVHAMGFLNRQQVKAVYQDSFAGLVVLHPISNYLDALPVKMFEYMSAGLPVIASNFPLWREIIEGNNCGFCVDPLSPEDIAQAINFLYQNPETAMQMGLNGQQAVDKKYNWQQEERKLLELYQQLS
jgi:glycosyltransferase involved in cell wall biosynthesis